MLAILLLFLTLTAQAEYTPLRYYHAHGPEKCHAAWKNTLDWRANNAIDLALPVGGGRKFDSIKSFCPHFFSGWDAKGNIIFVQCPGLTNFKALASANLTVEDLLFHYVFTIEYCWNVLDRRPWEEGGVMTSIIDLKGLRWSNVFSGEQIEFLKQFVSMMSDHYPQRSHKTLIINAPKWFSHVYKVVKPMLREKTREKIDIFSVGSKEVYGRLVEVCGEEGVCEDWRRDCGVDVIEGSRKVENGPDSPLEKKLREYVLERLEARGEKMDPVSPAIVKIAEEARLRADAIRAKSTSKKWF